MNLLPSRRHNCSQTTIHTDKEKESCMTETRHLMTLTGGTEVKKKEKEKTLAGQYSIQVVKKSQQILFFFLVNESQGGRRFKVDKVDTYSLIQQFKIIDSYFKNHN